VSLLRRRGRSAHIGASELHVSMRRNTYCYSLPRLSFRSPDAVWLVSVVSFFVVMLPGEEGLRKADTASQRNSPRATAR
jgi:hypothetical protein